MSKSCANFLLCGSNICLEPICNNCNIIFKNCKKQILLFGIGTCPICLTKEIMCISHPNCDHWNCNKCFIKDWNLVKKIYEPVFPYSSDMEEEYFENPNHMHWKKDKNIIKYIEETKKMLTNCPLC